MSVANDRREADVRGSAWRRGFLAGLATALLLGILAAAGSAALLRKGEAYVRMPTTNLTQIRDAEYVYQSQDREGRELGFATLDELISEGLVSLPADLIKDGYYFQVLVGKESRETDFIIVAIPLEADWPTVVMTRDGALFQVVPPVDQPN